MAYAETGELTVAQLKWFNEFIVLTRTPIQGTTSCLSADIKLRDGYNYLRKVFVRKGPRVTVGAHQVVGYVKYGYLNLSDETVIGMPEGLETSHLCGTRNCVNSDHIVFEARDTNQKRIKCHEKKICTKAHEPNCIFP